MSPLDCDGGLYLEHSLWQIYETLCMLFRPSFLYLPRHLLLWLNIIHCAQSGELTDGRQSKQHTNSLDEDDNKMMTCSIAARHRVVGRYLHFCRAPWQKVGAGGLVVVWWSWIYENKRTPEIVRHIKDRSVKVGPLIAEFINPLAVVVNIT